MARTAGKLLVSEEPGRQTLIHVVHSGSLYGTERSALWTLAGLRATWNPILIAPAGPLLDEARKLGIEVHVLRGRLGLFAKLWRLLLRRRSAALLTTRIGQSLLGWMAQLLACARVTHVCVVNGGFEEHEIYARRGWLARTPVQLVAVSHFVQQSLESYGVPPERVRTVENFLPMEAFADEPRRIERVGAKRRIVVVSKLDQIRKFELLLEALESRPELADLSVRVLGDGPARGEFERRARAAGLAVEFAGFQGDVAAELDQADGFVHTWSREPYGLAVAQALARGHPAIVPDAGGAADLVDHERTGLRYAANDASALADALCSWRKRPAAELERIGQRAWGLARLRFGQDRCFAELDALLTVRLMQCSRKLVPFPGATQTR